MGTRTLVVAACICTLVVAAACAQRETPQQATAMILYLHHSTGGVIWNGGVSQWLAQYNAAQGTEYKAV